MKLDANAIFEEELCRRGLSFERDTDDDYRLQVGAWVVSASLRNVRRNAERDRDPDAIRRFVDRLVQTGRPTPSTWAEASKHLLLSAEPADQDLGDTICSRVTDMVTRVLTLTDEYQSRVTWVTASMCKTWGVSPAEATSAALANQDGLLLGVELETAGASGSTLGMVPLDSPYKASVIFAPAFRRFVEATFGWPVWVVIPCRDFIYVVEEDSPLIGQMGTVVVNEFRSSGYPITTEVLRVSDDGIEAIGHFPA